MSQESSIQNTVRRSLANSELSALEKGIRELRERNEDLKELRVLLKELQQSTLIMPSKLTDQAVSRPYLSIRTASDTLHETLISQGICHGKDERTHYAKLRLDASGERNVTLRVAIICQKQPSPHHHLYVSKIALLCTQFPSLCFHYAHIKRPNA